MKFFFIIFLLIDALTMVNAQNSEPDFRWSNSYYYNFAIGDSVRFNDKNIRLLSVDHQFTRLLIGRDTLNLRVARRSLATSSNGIQLFVADNRNVANLTPGDPAHQLLTKDALVCISSDIKGKWLNPDEFIFPVSYNNGFSWRGDEDSYIFSLSKKNDNQTLFSYPGIGIDLHDARGIEKHWLVAIENSTVVWVEESDKYVSCVLLASNESPGIYYVYDKLFTQTVEVRKGQKLEKGELIGTAWGDDNWGHLQFAVVYAETAPGYQNRFTNCVNFFPQFFGLYYRESFSLSNYFSKGRIEFGRQNPQNGNVLNVSAFEENLGKGWKACSWNTAEKLDWVSKNEEGNVRISKTLFEGTPAECTNPSDFCDYEINVRNGVYRIRGRVGDVELASWQKLEFEGVPSGTFSLGAGEQKWTSEKVVKVEDRKLTIRIYSDNTGKTLAGLSELVFQQAY